MINASYRPCTCTNQHHLQPGDACEICQGAVDDTIITEDHNQQSDFFGYDYFEDLEFYLESVIHAA